MKRYVLEIKISKLGEEEQETISKTFTEEEKAVDTYKEAVQYFNDGLGGKLREVFNLEYNDLSFYFRGVPKLFKENVTREEYGGK